MSLSISTVFRHYILTLLFIIPTTAFSQSPPLIVEPESEQSGFSTDTFIPDFLGPGFVSINSGSTFDFSFDIPAGEEGLYQIQVRHASNNAIPILIDGTAITPDLALSTRTLGFWFDNEAYVTLSTGPHVISFGGPVFLDTFRITRTPPDPDRFLTYPTSVNEIFFSGSEENSNAYYNTIDPNGERSTLDSFREINGFTTGGINNYDESDPVLLAQQEALNGTDFSHAVYQNIADLDLGRNMFVLKFDNGDVASYVQNFATPDNALDRINLLATVAMEYRAEDRLTTFYAYGAGGQRVTKVDLDGRGQKFVPTLCAACHGGKPKDDINGVYQNNGNIGSKWIAWDLDNFEFSDRLSRTDQENEFRSMNQAVLCTTPSISNADLVRGWYGSADASSNCTTPLPDVAFNGEFVPDGWNNTPEHRELYLDVVRPTCRSCHAQRGTYADNTLLERKRELEFSTFEHFELYKEQIERHVYDQGTMPSALVTFEAFWRSRGSAKDQPEILDRVLFGGSAHVNPPASVYSSDAQNIFGARRQPGRPIAAAVATTVVTTGVEGRLNALPSDFATNTSWSVTAGDSLTDLPSDQTVLTVNPTGEHEVTLRVSNFDATYTDSATVTIKTDDEQRPSSVLFDPDIKDMLESNSAGLSCTSCHQSNGRANTVFHFSESPSFLGSLTPAQFAYTQALTRVDCRDPESSLLLRRPTNPNHFGGALFNKGDPNWTKLRRWIAEGAPFDEDRSFTEPGSDCGAVITDPDYKPFEGQTDSGIRADYPRVIITADTSGTDTAWVEFADNTKQAVDGTCRRQLVDTHSFDERVLAATVIDTLPDSVAPLSCDAIAALPKQDINSDPGPVQPGLDLQIREFAIIPDNTNVGSSLIKPGLLAMAHTDGRMFVVEQHEGKIWEFTDGVVGDQPWFDVHQAFINETGVGISIQNLFHGGLRSVAFHPEFASNGKFYTSQMRNRPDERDEINYVSDTAAINIFTDSTVSEWTVDAAGNLIGHRELFRIGYPAEDHLIKQIMFNPAATPGSTDYGLLYVAHGDGTLGDFFGSGQNDDALGKILRINPLADGDSPYTIPASNPFSNDDTWETDEVYALGLRNPHNLAFAQDGTLIAVDIGRSNIEEVNVITPGANYGWPEREGNFTHLKAQGGGFLTGIAPLPADDAALGFTYPAAQYGHIGSYGNPFTGHSIAGGFVVENGSAWDGQYLFGDFVNFGDVYHTSLQGLKNAVTQGSPAALTQSIKERARIVFDHDNDPGTTAQIFDTMLGAITASPRYFSPNGSSRADLRFGQGPDGEIYMMNKRNNTIYLVTNSVGEDNGDDNDNDPTTGTGPSIPGNLRHLVYSDTVAEIFWDRSTDDGFVQGYEVIRNGDSLGVRDALGVFEEGLDPAVTYTYAVTAIDNEGNRSATATINLSTGDSNPPSADTPAAPTGLRTDVYSATAAELFWDRPGTFGLSYEVQRDDKVLTKTDGVSYFDDSLRGGTTYHYQITTIDLLGNRSDSVSAVLTTFPGTPQDPTPQDPTPQDPSDNLVSATVMPTVDADNQVSWLFDADQSDLEIHVQPFAEMPLAANGQPARWNDLDTLGSRIFVVDEQDGRVYEISDRRPSLWFDIKSAIQAQTGRSLSTANMDHGGVRSIAFHPQFSDNGKFYAALMQQRPSDPSLHHYLSDLSGIDADSVLVEWTVNRSTFEVDVSSYREVFRVGIPWFENPIKQIAFNNAATSGDADFGLLYIAHGDGSGEFSTVVGGQGNSALGKILRINPLATPSASYSIPADNPFISDASLPDEVYSYGHRNPQHLSFTSNGLLLAAEAGRDNLDEVNLISSGANYGWSQREGAYVHQDIGTLVNGIAPLPENDAINGFTYPVVQFGHAGTVGATFSGQALGGGFVVENGSPLSGRYFYIDSFKTGNLYHSNLDDILSATTNGDPSELTVAKSSLATILFDHDGDPQTPALDSTLKDIVTSASGYLNTDDRLDLRIAQGSRGELLLMSKRNNIVYMITSSLPRGTEDPAAMNPTLGEPTPDDPNGDQPVSTGKPATDTGTHGFFRWDQMTAEAQNSLPSDCLLTAGGPTASDPVYCFSPANRRLMRVESNGNIAWQFSIPGENQTNRIESIDFVNGFTIALIGDVSPAVDDSAFSIAVFGQTGAFIGNASILKPIANPNGPDFPGINLDGLDLIVAPGPLRNNPNATGNDPTQLFLNDLYITGEYYSPIAGGDPSVIDGWMNEGAFRVKLDSRTGDTLDTLLFPGLSATGVAAICPVTTDQCN